MKLAVLIYALSCFHFYACKTLVRNADSVNTASHTDIKASANGIIFITILLTTGSYDLQRTNSLMG